MEASSSLAVALVLHGKIGLWTLRSSDVPAGDLRSTRHSPLQANAMVAPPKTPVRASNVSLWQLERWPHSLRIGFARFASKSILRHVVEPNRARGVRVDVFLHSWHPEIGQDLDALYAPAASQHEPVQPIHKVASQHLSMKRALALAAAHPKPHELVMVSRYDLLFFSELLFGAPPSGYMGLQPECMRLQPGNMGLQPECMRFQPTLSRGRRASFALGTVAAHVVHAVRRAATTPSVRPPQPRVWRRAGGLCDDAAARQVLPPPPARA